MKKRFLATVMVVAMLFSLSTISAYAANHSVGVLTIFSANNGSSASGGSTEDNYYYGHAWLSFKNTSSSPITIGKLKVNAGHEITFGTWGNKLQHRGMWYNLESYFINTRGYYPGRVSYSREVTQSDISIMNNFIAANDSWSYTNNCSGFAVKLWNKVAASIDAGIIPTPTTVCNVISGMSGHQTNRAIQNMTPIGYVENGVFIDMTSSASTLSIIPGIASTHVPNGAIQFTEDINMDPNSCG